MVTRDRDARLVVGSVIVKILVVVVQVVLVVVISSSIPVVDAR